MKLTNWLKSGRKHKKAFDVICNATFQPAGELGPVKWDDYVQISFYSKEKESFVRLNMSKTEAQLFQHKINVGMRAFQNESIVLISGPQDSGKSVIADKVKMFVKPTALYTSNLQLQVDRASAMFTVRGRQAYTKPNIFIYVFGSHQNLRSDVARKIVASVQDVPVYTVSGFFTDFYNEDNLKLLEKHE